ncbi:ATP phosphoribosyltransferase [Embleya sp. MST-111070]|uniref:ATP phosphoribosyltransferase n=1 Tax=Embleya sp. MST-111070 TaxID=3398231 RepID=UPI003F73DC33
MIRLALPKGPLWKHSLDLMDRLGMPVSAGDERRYAHSHPGLDLEVVVLKIPDIAGALGDRLVDFAVAPDEWLTEDDTAHRPITTLCWYHVRLAVLAPKDRARELDEALRAPGRVLTVATPYPAATARLLRTRAELRLRHVSGAVEAYPGRMSDLAVDCVESGDTARVNDLVEIRELLRCDVRLVAHPRTDMSTEAARRLLAAVHQAAVDPRCAHAPAPPGGGV